MKFRQPKGGIILSTLCSIFFFLWGGFLIVNPAVAADITVCSSGCDCTSIQAGIIMASPGDRVVVGAGTYYENIGIIKGINVVSEGADTATSYTGSDHTTTALERATRTIIHGNGSDSVIRIPDLDTEVILDGFTIENASVADMFLIRVGGGSPIIKNNIIRNNEGTGHSGGIGLQGFGAEVSPTIEKNLIHNVQGPGIGNGPNSHATITSNEIWGCGISGDQEDDNAPGIGLMGNASPTIENNILFENNQAGIGSYGFGIEANGDTLNIPAIKGNIIRDNGRAGIGLQRTVGDSGTINVTIGESGTDIDNIIYGNSLAGIRLDGISNAVIENNDIYSNAMGGIRTMSGTDQLTIKDNLIHENRQAGIHNAGASSLIVTGNDIYLNGTQHQFAGININHSGSTATIANNSIRENTKAGIHIASADSVNIEENDIYANGMAGISDYGPSSVINHLTVTGNDIYNNVYAGIDINESDDVTIDQNNIYQNTRAGIAIRGACTLEITRNEIYDNARGGIHTGTDEADGGGFTGIPGDALLTIRQNKVYRNGQTGYGGGIDVRHADGIINNNLVYGNYMAGIRFGDYIGQIVNNTVVGNGQEDRGAGIVYDDLAGAVNDSPGGYAPDDIPIKNNICTNNVKAGINVKIGTSYACPENRDFNLLCRNNGIDTDTCIGPPYFCILMQLGGCRENLGEIFANPLFVDAANDNYHLLSGSPAENAGDDNNDMGAYGGSDPINW